jgi:hypothetical protein
MMSNVIKNDDELVRAIHQLPKTMEVESDLWPEIEKGIAGTPQSGNSGRRVGWGHQALAASVAIAFVAGLMFGRQIGDETAPVVQPSRDFAMLAALEANELEYQAAFREFIPVGASRTMLEPQAIDHIENTWA